MSLPRYSNYKESGIAWLGNVPAHWSIPAVGYRYEVLLGKMLDERRITGEHLAPYLRNVDVQWDRINTENLPEMDFSGNDLVRYALTPGDLLVCEGGEVGRAAIWRGDLGECYYQKALHRLRCWNRSEDVPRFMLYLLRAASSLNVFTASEGKSTIAHLTAETLRGYRFAFPPFREQVQIVDFLDRETSKIDALIAEQEKLLTLLAEKRQATISHAVTRGLNPEARMKDSGVAWLGEVPKHWGVGALGYLCSIETGATPDRGEPRYWNGSIPWLKTGEISWAPISEAEEFISEEGLANSAAKLAKPGTLLMAMYGQGVTRGRVALLEIEAAYNQACAAMLFGPRILPNFARYFFMAAYDYVRDSGNETSQMNLSAGLIAKFKLTIPPVDEQSDIVRELDSEITKFDLLNTEAERAIGLLKERRSALIAAAVTGKIDVRNAVPEELAA